MVEAPHATLDAWSEPKGHGAILRGLWRAAAAERLPHALWFHGRAGIGRFLAARWLALGLLCSRPADDGTPCASCGACKRAMRGSHGDLFFVDVRDELPNERSEELRIGRFVERDVPYWRGATVEEFLGHRALEGGWRIVIVRESERANDEAQNAILKMLEEPPERVLWLLECSQADALLPTIVSRCVRVGFEPLSFEETLGVLCAQGLDPARARGLARWSRGSPGQALDLANQAGAELRQSLLELVSGRVAPLTAARAIWELEGEFTGKTAKASERQRARFVLDTWLDVLRDWSALAAGVNAERLAHGDLASELEHAPLARSQARLACTTDRLLELRGDVDLNVDPPTLLDCACAALSPRGFP